MSLMNVQKREAVINVLKISNNAYHKVDLTLMLTSYKEVEVVSNYHEVVIMETLSDNTFYVNLKANLSDKNKMMSNLKDTCMHSLKRIPKDELLSGLPCTVFSKGNAWYRGRIECLRKIDALIYFVDYGNFDYVLFHDIYVLPQEYLSFPCQAIKCSPNSESSIFVMNMYHSKNFRINRDILCHFLFCTKTKVWKVDLIDLNYLKYYGNVVTLASHFTYSNYIIYEGYESIVSLAYIENLTCFYVQLPIIMPAFVNMQQLLQKIYEKMNHSLIIESKDQLQLNQAVAVNCSLDQNWYRAEILAINHTDIIIQYVDFGNKETIELNHIRKLHVEFLFLPKQALCCQLQSVSMPNYKWNNDIENLFKKKCSTVTLAKFCTFENEKYNIILNWQNEFLSEISANIGLIDADKSESLHQLGNEIVSNVLFGNKNSEMGNHQAEINLNTALGSKQMAIPYKNEAHLINSCSHLENEIVSLSNKENNSKKVNEANINITSHYLENKSVSLLEVKNNSIKCMCSFMEIDKCINTEELLFMKVNFLKPNWKVNSKMKVIISWIYCCDNIWVQKYENLSIIKRIENELTSICDVSMNCIEDPKLGMQCIVNDAEKYYRGFILAFDQKQAAVFLIDYGKTVIKTKNELFVIPENFTEYPAQAINCSLADLPHTEVLNNILKFELLKKNIFRNYVYLYLVGVNKKKFIVKLRLENENGFINDEIIKTEKECKVTLPEVELNKAMKVKLLNILSLEDICLQICDPNYLSRKTNTKLLFACSGQFCMVKMFTNEFYRGKIIDAENYDKLKVMLIDYGQVKECNITSLFHITDKFQIHPPCIINCKTNCFHSINRKFDDELKKMLMQYFCNSKKYQCVICKKNNSYIANFLNINLPQSVCDKVKQEDFSKIDNNFNVEHMLDPPLNIHLPVNISHIENGGYTYFQLKTNESVLFNFQKKLNKHCDLNTECTLIEPYVGLMCAAKFSKDDQWYRAKIINLNNKVATIKFIDYGNNETKLLSSLKCLGKEFQNTAAFSIVALIPCWKNIAVDIIWKKIINRNWKAVFRRSDEELVAEIFEDKQKNEKKTEKKKTINVKTKENDSKTKNNINNKTNNVSIIVNSSSPTFVKKNNIKSSDHNNISIDKHINAKNCKEKKLSNVETMFSTNNLLMTDMIKNKSDMNTMANTLLTNYEEMEKLRLRYDCDIAQNSTDELYCDLRVLLPEKTYQAFVTHVNSPDSFFIQLNEDTDILNSLEIKLKEAEFFPVIEKENVVAGLACVAKFPLDQKWYRSYIMNVNIDSDFVIVKYIDYGNTYEIPMTDLRYDCLHINLYHLAFECCLHTPEQINWSPDQLQLFKSIANADVMINLQLIYAASEKNFVSLQINNVDVASHLLENEKF